MIVLSKDREKRGQDDFSSEKVIPIKIYFILYLNKENDD
jgi:hypothetical protein